MKGPARRCSRRVHIRLTGPQSRRTNALLPPSLPLPPGAMAGARALVVRIRSCLPLALLVTRAAAAVAARRAGTGTLSSVPGGSTTLATRRRTTTAPTTRPISADSARASGCRRACCPTVRCRPRCQSGPIAVLWVACPCAAARGCNACAGACLQAERASLGARAGSLWWPGAACVRQSTLCLRALIASIVALLSRNVLGTGTRALCAR